MKKAAFLTVSIALMLMLLGAALFGQGVPKDNLYKYLSIFTEVYALVRNNYVEDVPSDQLVNGAFSGVTEAVDEFSYYVPPAMMASYRDFADDEAGGVGLVVTKRFGYAFVIAPVPGSAADRAGLLAGDFIEKVNDQPTQNMALWQVRSALHPQNGKSVKLTVLRGGMSKRDEFTVKEEPRAVQAPAAKEYGDVTYVKIPFFDKGTSSQLRSVLDSVTKANRKKLIIDVRGNAGGSYEEAISSADEVLTRGTITALSGKRIAQQHWDADPAAQYNGAIEVLVDSSTAGPAEVFAAAIGQNQRGKLVGVTTYGKGISQKFVQLPSGGGLFLTVAHYTTPDMKPIKEQGLRPDVTVDLMPSFAKKGTTKDTNDDPILEKALKMYGDEATRKAA